MAEIDAVSSKGYSGPTYDSGIGLTSSSEKIFSLDPSKRASIHVVPSPTAEYQIKISAQDSNPSDFTGFASVDAENQTGIRFQTFECCVRWIGVDVVSGTVDVYVRQAI